MPHERGDLLRRGRGVVGRHRGRLMPTLHPDAAGFRAAADAGARVISVHARVQADGLTATGLYHQLCGERPGTFLLESAEHGSFGRWSFIGVNALGTLSASRGQATWEGRPLRGLPLDLSLIHISEPTRPY